MRYEIKDGVGVIYLDGRFDTTAVQSYGNEILEFAKRTDFDKVKVDASDLEYISSAGLRIMMQIAKSGKEFSVEELNAATYEIFSVTGFIDVMTVKKKYRVISVDDLEIIRRDDDGFVYELPDDKMLKVYNSYVDEDHVDKDKDTVKKLLLEGLPVMIALETVRIEDGRMGIIFVK